MTTSTGRRTVPPLRLEPAYADRNATWRKMIEHAPYPLMAAAKGYEMMNGGPLDPWFRKSWPTPGEHLDPALNAMLHDQHFIDAAGRLFGAEVVRPQSLVVNVMGPMDAGYRHVDLPTYRGINMAKTPLWFPLMMGASGLFERWAVRVAGVLTWFYDGNGGGYEYWPHGLGNPSECESGPFGNFAVVGDNDLMWHQVGAFGNAEEFRDNVTLTRRSAIRPAGDGWEIVDGTTVIAALPAEKVRVSLLWRATTFRDEREARVYDQHEDDLDLDTAMSMFCADLTIRGETFAVPDDPLGDEGWRNLLTRVYLLAGYT